MKKNIEEIDYENQCSTGMHYLCDECKNGWKNNLFEGEGIERFWDGSFYKGTWKEDEKDGSGTMVYKNGK